MVSCRERLKSQTDCDLCGRVTTTHMYTANHKQPHTQTSSPFLSGPEERLATVDGFQKAAGLSPREFAFVLVSLFQPLSSEHTAVDVSQSLQIDFVVNMLWNHVIISYFLSFNSMKKLLWFRHSGMISPTKIVYVRNKGKLNLITENNVFFFRIPHLVSFAHNMETFSADIKPSAAERAGPGRPRRRALEDKSMSQSAREHPTITCFLLAFISPFCPFSGLSASWQVWMSANRWCCEKEMRTHLGQAEKVMTLSFERYVHLARVAALCLQTAVNHRTMFLSQH